ncbi:ABC transporter permease [Methanolobus sp. WCC4]|uniref:ABC transporter permease n=1 Tax=Methanolobus sp. WCC4 TaxID=3125784 RepID=UPI0030FB4F48
MIDLRHSFIIALGSISSAKMRSALTALGIIIGVAAVVANVSLGASFNQYFTDELGSLGSNFIIIYSQDVNIFYDAELELIRNTPGIDSASAFNQQTAAVTYISSTRQIDVQGVGEDARYISNLLVEEGNFLSDKDKYVAVIGKEVAEEKFDKDVSIKNYMDITIKRDDGTTVTRKFRVKGILASEDNTFVTGGPDRDVTIYVPIATLNEMLNVTDYVGFSARTEDAESVGEVADEVDKRLARSLGVPTRDLDNDDAKPYRIFDQAEIIEQLDALADSLTVLITLIAVVALIVGSIGIMNIMLVTVTERTREIGLLKSLGYTRNGILTLFILESITVGVIGGILGTLLGLVGSYVVEVYLNIPPVFPFYLVFLGFFISVFVGLVAGVYPANKAANLDPVEALRHE